MQPFCTVYATNVPVPVLRLTSMESYCYLLGEEKGLRVGFKSLKYLKDALQGEVFKIYTMPHGANPNYHGL